MKLYVQTEVLDPATQSLDARPPVLIRETAADAAAGEVALRALIPGLGVIIAIPAAAHESNLKVLLGRDLAGLPDGPGEEGRVTLKVRRSPIENAEGHALSYDISRS